MEIYKKQTLAETFSVYFDRRMIKILLLGAISGFPWVIIGSSLSLWLKEDGLSPVSYTHLTLPTTTLV